MSSPQIQVAEEAFHRGDLNTAERICAEVLQKSPQDAPATLISGMVAAQRGQTQSAIDHLKRALTLSPNDYAALVWLQSTLRMASQFDDAIEIGEQAHRLWPEDAEILANLGLAYLGKGDLERALANLKLASAKQPSDVVLKCRLAAAYELAGHDLEAGRLYRAAIDLDPASDEPYVRLGKLLVRAGMSSDAQQLAETGLIHKPRSPQLNLMLAEALRANGDRETGQAVLQRAIDLDSSLSLVSALWLSEEGRFEEAALEFEASIRQRPVQGTAYLGLLRTRRSREEDRPLLKRMESLLSESRLLPKERSALFYGLGKAYDELGEFERAMGFFDAGNDLNRQVTLIGNAFERRQASCSLDRTIEMFTSEFIAGHRESGSESRLPIFIVGMIRSGTTLVEQIISAHPEVGAGGEQRFWLNESPGLVNLREGTFDTGKLIEAHDRYLQILMRLHPTARHVTDKMPLNFSHLGPIHIAFPQARIIHVRRHPVDTALSIYMTEMGRPPDFAHDRRNIVAEFRSYRRLMEHWHSVIPAECLLEIRYEDLIEDQETWSRKLIEFCGLEWRDECLDFHRSRRAVGTPSAWQVRQPIYRSSVGRWRSYEPWLRDFAELQGR